MGGISKIAISLAINTSPESPIPPVVPKLCHFWANVAVPATVRCVRAPMTLTVDW